MARYVKTARGQAEIAQRSGALGLRARRLLILIDGVRDTDELDALSADSNFAGTLAQLEQDGYIEQRAQMTGAASTDVSPPAAAPAPSPHHPDLQTARDFMMNTLRTFNGPYAKLDLVKRIHASAHREELKALVDEWLSSISESRIGRKRADELSARLMEVI